MQLINYNNLSTFINYLISYRISAITPDIYSWKSIHSAKMFIKKNRIYSKNKLRKKHLKTYVFITKALTKMVVVPPEITCVTSPQAAEATWGSVKNHTKAIKQNFLFWVLHKAGGREALTIGGSATRQDPESCKTLGDASLGRSPRCRHSFYFSKNRIKMTEKFFSFPPYC